MKNYHPSQMQRRNSVANSDAATKLDDGPALGPSLSPSLSPCPSLSPALPWLARDAGCDRMPTLQSSMGELGHFMITWFFKRCFWPFLWCCTFVITCRLIKGSTFPFLPPTKIEARSHDVDVISLSFIQSLKFIHQVLVYYLDCIYVSVMWCILMTFGA